MLARLRRFLHFPKECIFLGTLFSAFLCFGYEISQNGFCDYSIKGWLVRFAYLIPLAIIGTILLKLFFGFLDSRAYSSSSKRTQRLQDFLYQHTTASALLAGLFILLCWIPVFFAFYPGIYAYDTPNQTWQVYASDYNTHHPLIHTLFMGFFVNLGKHLLSYNFGIALYTCVQMLIMAAIFTYCLHLLLKWRCPTWLFVFATLFFALYPTSSLFAINATKDTLFSGFFLLTTFLLYDLLRHKAEQSKNVTSIILYIISATLTCLFRNNGIYTLIFMLPILLLVPATLRKKGVILVATLLSFCAFTFVNHVFEVTLHPTKGSVAEMLSIPIQQFGRMVSLHGDELTEEDYELLHTYIAEDKLTLYNASLSDPIKDGFQADAFQANTKHFIQTWFSFFKRYPGTFVNAFLCSSLGNWYPDSDYGSYIELSVKDMWGKIPDMHRNSKFPQLEQLFTDLFANHKYESNPVLFLLFNPMLFVWLLFILIGYMIYQRQYLFLPVIAPYIGLWGTLLLGPVALVRYMLPIILSLPLLLYLLVSCRKGSTDRSES